MTKFQCHTFFPSQDIKSFSHQLLKMNWPHDIKIFQNRKRARNYFAGFKTELKISIRNVTHKAICIWKFVQRQSPHLGFRWRYHHILFGYQARIFHFSFFNVSHKSLSFITWNLIEYLHTQDLQRAMAHLNVWANILLFCFVYGCKTTPHAL